MTAPINPALPVPYARSAKVVVWQDYPYSMFNNPGQPLPVVSCQFSDDASRATQEQLTVELAYLPDGVRVGMWVAASIGQPLYDTDALGTPLGQPMVITAINRNMIRQGGASLTAEDPTIILNGRPYEIDTTLTGTLRSLVDEVCKVSLNWAVDVNQVPDIPLPAEAIAEFGAPRWDTCLKMADALGVGLRFSGHWVYGWLRNRVAPSPRATLTRASVPPGGTEHLVRTPTAATVLVTRGGDVPPLIGHATLSTPPPSFYLPHVVTDRREGDADTTQAHADQLARDLLTAQLTGVDVYTGLSVLPTQLLLWAGDSTVILDGKQFYVRAITVSAPALTTEVTLRAVIEP